DESAAIERSLAMRIALMVPDLNLDGDAVGNDVLGMYTVLVSRGFEVRLYVRTPPRGTSMPTFPYTELGAWLRRGDAVVYHYATRAADAVSLLAQTAGRVILGSPTVPPPLFFRGCSAE